MTQTLQPIGDRLGLVIDPTILVQLGITAETPLELIVTSDGKSLLIRPVGGNEAAEHRARVRDASARVIETHRATFKKLAE